MEWRQLASRPVCRKEAVVRGENYRITILTPRLFRLEYSEDGVFEDRPTQCVLNREFPPVQPYSEFHNGILQIGLGKFSVLSSTLTIPTFHGNEMAWDRRIDGL